MWVRVLGMEPAGKEERVEGVFGRALLWEGVVEGVLDTELERKGLKREDVVVVVVEEEVEVLVWGEEDGEMGGETRYARPWRPVKPLLMMDVVGRRSVRHLLQRRWAVGVLFR